MCRVELSLFIFLFHFSFFCLLFLFACVVLSHYVVNKDEYIDVGRNSAYRVTKQTGRSSGGGLF